MTREEAKKEAFIETSMAATSGINWMTDTFVDKIYDSFEAKRCENCKQYEAINDKCNFGVSTDCRNEVPKDFGCNKFSRREQDAD